MPDSVHAGNHGMLLGGEGLMSNYRVYCLANGAIAKAHWIEADDDDQAMLKARTVALGAECKVWQGTRMIGKMESNPPTGKFEERCSSFGDAAPSF